MSQRRETEGVVISNKMQKTVVVRTKQSFRHPLYGKVVESQHKLIAHDDLGAKMGDRVRLIESHPISKTKRWVVVEILSHKEREEVV
ncbi:MAG: 30S ribosomal protein S17 [Anaerolineales bacterium]